MDREFVPSGEQLALRDAVRDHCARAWDEAAVRAVAEHGKQAPQAWRALGEQLGVLGLLVPERFGGADAGVVEAAVVAEELGAALAPVPYLSTLYATRLLLDAGDEQACADLLPGLCDGSRSAAVADSFTATVVDATTATDLFVVSDGVLCHATTADRTPVSTLDLTRPQADVVIDPATARRIGPVDARAARNVVLALLAAEQVGVARTMLDLAVSYAKERRQFGRPIGSFQAVKHRCADMLVELELARSVAAHAAWTLDHGDEAGGDDPDLAASLAHVVTSQAARAVTAGAMQVLGGVAITWEHRAHLYYKRAIASAALWGGRAHRARLAELVLSTKE